MPTTPALGGRGEDRDAAGAGGVHRQLAGLPGAGGGQSLDQAGQLAVRHGQQHQVGLADRLVGGHQRHPGQQPVGPPLGLRADPGGGHHPVPGPAERGTEHRPDPTDPDDGNPQPRGVTGLDHG